MRIARVVRFGVDIFSLMENIITELQESQPKNAGMYSLRQDINFRAYQNGTAVALEPLSPKAFRTSVLSIFFIGDLSLGISEHNLCGLRDFPQSTRPLGRRQGTQKGQQLPNLPFPFFS